MLHPSLLLIALLPAAPDPQPSEPGKLRDAMLQAHHDFDDAAVQATHEKILALAAAQPQALLLQRAAAEGYLIRADRLRHDRTIRELESSVVKQHRAQQAEYGRQGMFFARRALQLAGPAEEKAHAERLIGELYVHQIDGPIAGFTNGPRALDSIRKALQDAPDDPECQRAQGLMFLYNPPINGGDVERAIETFRRCAEKDPSNDVYLVLLSMAYRKRGSPERAEVAARRALRLNPKSLDAKHLVEALEREKEAARR